MQATVLHFENVVRLSSLLPFFSPTSTVKANTING